MVMATDRRERLRVKLPGIIWGSLGVRNPVRVINLSPHGAMIEHAQPLSQGGTLVLDVRLAGMDLRLRGRIVRTQVHSAGRSLEGEQEIRFRSGVHFPDHPEAAAAHIRHYLTTLRGPGSNPTEEME